ncbi:Eco57I restriction-modification methylase domain-containing protein [Pseudothauera rhizosphaerae]|uniref:site-specific DNA-methyltransferase (adenine-specific) n=1 Tax=Pseudothauera rhizosphaerae TaxID=2565932 RepID=A0A4S4AMM5_9RHOO|nr:class I SAM-dependent methyltransferase [Pseudothauera rhizosphaerae]THF60840.1 class I SAM-dependent methyltransferase [Pseudothauera rhizosphaerae]
MSRLLDVATLGQVFTPADIVSTMLALRANRGRVLEPSAGDGAFSRHLPGCVAIEMDARVAPSDARVMDFFAYPLAERFDTVIGNPPYVRHQDIAPETRARLDSTLFDARSNLFLFFIEKSVRHLDEGGELIFITPREFIKLTAAAKLNDWLYEQGTITHWIETGDTRIFSGAVPNCAIFRFVRGDFSRRTLYRRINDAAWDEREMVHIRGQLAFTHAHLTVPLAALFEVKVGAVSGADDIFEHPDGNLEFVCSRTAATGEKRRMIYDLRHPHLEQHKARLLARRVRHFDEGNWWKWGRAYHDAPGPRIYVNGKTRRVRPFFTNKCEAYDGSILALFPKVAGMDVARAVDLLNDAVPWEELGFVVDGRYLFTQRTLATLQLPEIFAELLPREPSRPERDQAGAAGEAAIMGSS